MVESETTVGQTSGLSLPSQTRRPFFVGPMGRLARERLTKKESELQQLRAASPQVIRNQLSREKRDLSTLHKSLGIVAGALCDEKLAELKGQVTELAVQKQAFQAAVQLAFADSRFRELAATRGDR